MTIEELREARQAACRIKEGYADTEGERKIADVWCALIDAEIERRNTPNKGRVRAYNDGFMHWINCWECGGILEVYKPGDMPGEVGNYCRFCGVKFE